MEGGVCVDLTKMEEIEEYHQEDFDVSVRPGVTRQDILRWVVQGGAGGLTVGLVDLELKVPPFCPVALPIQP